MLEWSFIANALRRIGLHNHFISLIHACISTPTFAVLVNGEPTAGFSFPERDLTRLPSIDIPLYSSYQ